MTLRLFFLIAFMAWYSIPANAQIYLKGRNDKIVQLDTMSEVQYISIIVWGVPLSQKVRILIDCGLMFDPGLRPIGAGWIDRKGDILRFDSRMEAFNRLYQAGWMYKNTYIVVDDGDSQERHIFERRVPVKNSDSD